MREEGDRFAGVTLKIRVIRLFWYGRFSMLIDRLYSEEKPGLREGGGRQVRGCHTPETWPPLWLQLPTVAIRPQCHALLLPVMYGACYFIYWSTTYPDPLELKSSIFMKSLYKHEETKVEQFCETKMDFQAFSKSIWLLSGWIWVPYYGKVCLNNCDKTIKTIVTKQRRKSLRDRKWKANEAKNSNNCKLHICGKS